MWNMWHRNSLYPAVWASKLNSVMNSTRSFPPCSSIFSLDMAVLFLHGIFKETCQDQHKFCVGFVVKVVGQITAYLVDDFKGCSFIHMEQEEPFLITISLKCYAICLNASFALNICQFFCLPTNIYNTFKAQRQGLPINS